MSTSSDIMDHYTLLEDEDGSVLFSTLTLARARAAGDDRHVWFVREGDEPEDDDDAGWDVEGWRGQFVNCLGFFVTLEPRKAEHDDTIFTY